MEFRPHFVILLLSNFLLSCTLGPPQQTPKKSKRALQSEALCELVADPQCPDSFEQVEFEMKVSGQACANDDYVHYKQKHGVTRSRICWHTHKRMARRMRAFDFDSYEAQTTAHKQIVCHSPDWKGIVILETAAPFYTLKWRFPDGSEPQREGAPSIRETLKNFREAPLPETITLLQCLKPRS
ncbi:MAG: hypothetical protein AAF203_05835 [Pseudomonadota bacterium]